MTQRPGQPLALPDKLPPVVNRDEWVRQRDELLLREKAHTHEGDAIAAARRRLPMVRVSDTAVVEGDVGAAPLKGGLRGSESAPFARFMGYRTPWYSARGCESLLAGRGFGMWCFYLRDDADRVYETYSTTGGAAR